MPLNVVGLKVVSYKGPQGDDFVVSSGSRESSGYKQPPIYTKRPTTRNAERAPTSLRTLTRTVLSWNAQWTFFLTKSFCRSEQQSEVHATKVGRLVGWIAVQRGFLSEARPLSHHAGVTRTAT